MSELTVPAPTYDEGYRKGFEDAHAEIREEQLASVFDRDVSHVSTLVTLAHAVLHRLGSVAACSQEDRARGAASKLVDELNKLSAVYQEIADEHRAAAMRRGEERRSS